MIKILQRSVSVILVFTFLMTVIPFTTLADTADQSATIYFTNAAFTNSNMPDNKGIIYSGDPSKPITLTKNAVHAYMQLDFTGYEAILAEENTKVVATITGGGYTGSASLYYGDFKAYVVNDSADKAYNGTATTYNQANALGMHNTNRPVLFTNSDGSEAKTAAGKQFTLQVDKTVLLNALNEGTDNSIVTLYLVDTHQNSSNQHAIMTATDKTYITIEYDENSVDNNDYLSDITQNIEWSDISDENADAVGSQLPTLYKGATISWSSAESGIVDSDGTIHPPLGEAKTVELIATFSYKDATATANFTVTLKPEQAKTATIYFKNASYTQKNGLSNMDDKGQTTHWDGTTPLVRFDKDRWYGYMQAELKGFEEILADETTTVSATIACGVYANSWFSCSDFNAYLVNDIADNSYKAGTTTWRQANNLNMHDTTNLFFSKNDGNTISKKQVLETYSANKNALVTCLNEGRDNSHVTIYLKAKETESRIVAEQSYITITYFESQINEKEYVDSLESEFDWNKLSSDEQTVVTNDLATYYKGLNIEWSSLNGTVTSSGEVVAIDGQIAEDTVTATASFKENSFTKEFTIKVCDGKITIGSPALDIADSTATSQITIVNGTTDDITYLLYLAIYDASGEMTALTPFPLEISKGTEGTKELTAVCPTGSKAKFMVWENDEITPAIPAIEK